MAYFKCSWCSVGRCLLDKPVAEKQEIKLENNQSTFHYLLFDTEQLRYKDTSVRNQWVLETIITHSVKITLANINISV